MKFYFRNLLKLTKLGKQNKYDLEERLINFAIMIYNLENEIPKTRFGNNSANQISKS